MTDKFTINLEYDRDEIIDMAQKAMDKGAGLITTKDLLDQFYPAWFCDERTSLTVELMFRKNDNDFFKSLFARKLAELNEKEGVTA